MSDKYLVAVKWRDSLYEISGVTDDGLYYKVNANSSVQPVRLPITECEPVNAYTKQLANSFAVEWVDRVIEAGRLWADLWDIGIPVLWDSVYHMSPEYKQKVREALDTPVDKRMNETQFRVFLNKMMENKR
jgi:hypothetical protein